MVDPPFKTLAHVLLPALVVWMGWLGFCSASLPTSVVVFPEPPSDAIFISSFDVQRATICGIECALTKNCSFIRTTKKGTSTECQLLKPSPINLVEESQPTNPPAATTDHPTTAVATTIVSMADATTATNPETTQPKATEVATTQSATTTTSTDCVPSVELDAYDSCAHALKTTCEEEKEFEINVIVDGDKKTIKVLCRKVGTDAVAIVYPTNGNRTKWEGPYNTVTFFIVYEEFPVRIVALVDSSTRCKQFLKLECQDSKVSGNDGMQWYKLTPGTDTVIANFFPSSFLNGDTECSCSDGSEACCCGGDGPACDCDTKDGTLHVEDYGYITGKEYLPISKLQFKDVDTQDNKGKFTVGPLECVFEGAML